jgi:phosphoribosylaminoimidazole-succinocarboxamide synthase
VEKQALLYEGKAKRIYETDHGQVVWVQYKDDATAFNGEKKDKITGKGELNNQISSLLFQVLNQAGVKSHFMKKLSATEQLVKKVDILPLEVVVRNTVAGSLAKRTGLEEGTQLSHTLVEFYYKNDDLGDPLLNTDHIRELNLATPEQIETMKEEALSVNRVLEKQFSDHGIVLVDFKLEFGLTPDGELLLADEVSPDTCRLWDAKTMEKFDKDVFRRDLGDLTTAYREILTRLGGSLHV